MKKSRIKRNFLKDKNTLMYLKICHLPFNQNKPGVPLCRSINCIVMISNDIKLNMLRYEGLWNGMENNVDCTINLTV